MLGWLIAAVVVVVAVVVAVVLYALTRKEEPPPPLPSGQESGGDGGEKPVGCVKEPCPPEEKGDLAVEIVQTSGAPIESADVAISGPEYRSGTTDDKGIALFSGIAPGPYFVEAKADGFGETANKQVVADTTNQVTLTLVPLKLVKITVIANATQTNVTGAKNWACVKKATDDVIVEATTRPNTVAAWNQIIWSGDSGASVPGKSNQRKLSRTTSKKYHIEAELGGVKDQVDVWVLWAEVTILTSDTTPANAVQFGAKYDGTEELGAKSYDGGKEAVGKVVPVAKITPEGVQDVVQSGWTFKRERWSHDWDDGNKSNPGNDADDYWNTEWVDDTSFAVYQRLEPDSDDKIYDRDAPNIAGFGSDDSETYNNFREWVEWNNEKCSDHGLWYWKGHWQKSEDPQVTLKQVGTGNIELPEDSELHP